MSARRSSMSFELRNHSCSLICIMGTVQLRNELFLPELIELIGEGHTVTITARGNSMNPFIRNNRDKLVFSAFTEVKTGDVVLAEISQGTYVCHRIVSIDGDMITLRGDGNTVGTEQCPFSSVRAILTAVVRGGKTYDISTSRTWKTYSWLWMHLLPLRRYLLAVYRRL